MNDGADLRFIGRQDQLELLTRRLADARQGLAKTIVVGGEAGVGKSRLLREFGDTARGAGAHVLWGSCEEYFGSPMPYAPLIEALEGFAREHEDEQAAMLGGPAYASLTRFLGLTGELPADSMGSQQQVFLAVRRMLDHAGTGAPVVLVVEDLHWADASTLDLVRHLAQAPADGRRLLLVCSHRSSELVRDAPLWRLLANPGFMRRVERIQLPVFTKAELREFLDVLGAGPIRPDVLGRCFEWSDGIAFHAEQLMAAGVLDAPGTMRLPDDVTSVVMSRLAGLGTDAVKVLRVAAVAGRRMSRRLLRTVSKLGAEALNDALQECFDRQMLVAEQEENVYRFRHALLREAVYQTTVPDMRVDLHIAMAAALAADPRLCVAEGLAAAEQASHWYLAGEWPQALAAAVQAGETAVRTLAFPSAELQFERALELWTRVDDAQGSARVSKVQLLASAADAARWSGHVEQALQHVRAAIAELGRDTDPGRAGELHERLGNYLWEAGQRAESVVAYQQAADLLEDEPDSATKARLLAGLALAELQAGRYADGGRTAEAALVMARTVGARAEEGRALNISGLALGMLGRATAGEERLRQALGIARSVNHIEDLFRAYGNLGLVLEHAGRLAESAEVTREGLEAARQLGLANTRQGTVLANNTSAALVLLGEWDEAEKIITEVSLDRPVRESLYPRLTLVEVKVARGDFAQAHELLASVSAVEQGRDPRFLGPFHAFQAELALWEGELALADAEVRLGVDALRGTENTLELLRLCAIGMRCAADRSTAPGAEEADRASGAAAGDQLARLARAAVDSAPETAEIRQLVGLCTAERRRARHEDTAVMWGDVAAGWARLDRRYPSAYARWREAAAALSSDDRPRARDAARSAHATATALGAVPLRAKVESLARNAGNDRNTRIELADRRRPERLPYGLTPTEVAILRHLHDGHDTARTASLRGVSVRTVETQLRNAYAKLGVHSRVEAVAAARREGLFGD